MITVSNRLVGHRRGVVASRALLAIAVACASFGCAAPPDHGTATAGRQGGGVRDDGSEGVPGSARPWHTVASGVRATLTAELVGDALLVDGSARGAASPEVTSTVRAWVDLHSGAVSLADGTQSADQQRGGDPAANVELVGPSATLHVTYRPRQARDWTATGAAPLTDLTWSSACQLGPPGQPTAVVGSGTEALRGVALMLPVLSGDEWGRALDVSDRDPAIDDPQTAECRAVVVLFPDGRSRAVRLETAERLSIHPIPARTTADGIVVGFGEASVATSPALYMAAGRAAVRRLVVVRCDVARGVGSVRTVFAPDDGGSALATAYSYAPDADVAVYAVLRRAGQSYTRGTTEVWRLRVGAEEPPGLCLQLTGPEGADERVFWPVLGSETRWVPPPRVPQWMRPLGADEVVWVSGDGVVTRQMLGP